MHEDLFCMIIHQKVTTQNENPMKCTTASSSTGYTWQTNGDKTVEISWKDHFINTVHADGHFLSPISAYEPRLTDSGRRIDYKKIENKFDDYEGKMNRNGINNINGIVQFEFAYQSPSSNVSNLSWTDLGLLENIILTLPSSEDGFSQMFWVRAIDAIGNTKEDTAVVYFDASSPSIGLPIMDYNVENGRYNFSSKQVFINKRMKLSFASKDDHSGVPLVTLKIVTQSGEIKYEHRYKGADLIVNASDCQNIVECYCSEADRNKCYMSTLRLDIDNCWMGVAMNATTIETYKLEITSYNGAMLSRQTIKEILKVTDLSGIPEYNRVTNLKVEIVTEYSFKITWKQPRSCYERLGMKLIVTNEAGHSQEHKVFKRCNIIHCWRFKCICYLHYTYVHKNQIDSYIGGVAKIVVEGDTQYASHGFKTETRSTKK
ncbi:unnamed protein product [Mytilus edulis]|uniref:Uncharacterized protein n=1 Tax=Mytilus edulis TaxID=6550 RepID=A0A8S3RZD9_MYTED|nr:unnamed protein product [Mytilus edulis]